MQNFLEKNVETLLSEGLKKLGYSVVRVKFFASDKRKTLQIMIEREDDLAITIEDCERVSYHVSPILDTEELIKDEYDLEISSAGIDRPLVKLEDFVKYTGFEVKLKTNEAIDGSKNFSGRIISLKDGIIELRIVNNKTIFIAYNIIESANLILTNELLSKTKH